MVAQSKPSLATEVRAGRRHPPSTPQEVAGQEGATPQRGDGRPRNTSLIARARPSNRLKSLKNTGAGEALRPKFLCRFFFVIPITYACGLIFVLDALLDVSLDTLSQLNLAHVPLETRFRPLRKPMKYGGNVCISKTALPPNTLAPTTSKDRTRSRSISLL
jgi:hypothetical protein